jgi:EmrB/QacA subfamily drug resistance transporter
MSQLSSTVERPPQAATGRAGLARRPGYGHPWLTLVAVAFGVMMVGLDATVVAIANPAIARDLNANLSQLQWVTNGYLLALAVSLITAGKLADRFGRKTIFFAGVAGFALASVGVGLSGSIGMVIFWRVVQGLAGALLQPATLAILRNAFPANKLNMAIGIWGGTSALAIASGPIVGGLLVQHVSWQSVFFINAPVAVLTLLLGAWVIRPSRDPQAVGSFDLPGVALLSASLFSLVWGLIKAQAYGFGDVVPLGFFAAALVLGVAFVLRERGFRQPLLPLSLFRSVSLSAGTLLVTLAFFALFGAFFFLTLYLQQVHGMQPVDAGVRLLPLTATFMVSAPLAGLINARLGPRVTLVAGMLLAAVSLFGLRLRDGGRHRGDRGERAGAPGRGGRRVAADRRAARRRAGHHHLRHHHGQPGRRGARRPADRRRPAGTGGQQAVRHHRVRRAGRRAGAAGHSAGDGEGHHHRQPPGLHGRLPHRPDRRRDRGPGRRGRRAGGPARPETGGRPGARAVTGTRPAVGAARPVRGGVTDGGTGRP